MQNIVIQGKHTAAAIRELGLPRFQINVGDRNRVRRAIEALDLQKPQLLDVEGTEQIGRKALATGNYCVTVKNGKGEKKVVAVPLLIVETGMGMPTVQIIQEEMVKYAENVPIIQIRAGTAGGVNSENMDEPVMKRGDLVCASHNVGRSGALEHKLGFFQKYTFDSEGREELFAFAEKLHGMDMDFAKSFRFVRNSNDPYVVDAIVESAKNLGYSIKVGGTFSKESLEAEENAPVMFALRRDEGVIATEMEQLENAFLASYMRWKHGIPVLTGMVAALTGAKPGEGFGETPQDETLIEESVGKALRVAADSFVRLFLKDGKEIVH